MKQKRAFLFLLAFFSLFQPALAQVSIPTDEQLEQGTDEQKIEAAEYFYDKKMYLQSLRIWKNLLKNYPDNARINYMAGKCILLSNRDRASAINYFSKTLTQVSNKLSLDQKHFDQVPADALFFMGQACHLNLRFDDALDYYQQFTTRVGPKMPDQLKKEVERWTQWTNNAKTMLASADKGVRITNLGATINTAAEEYSPVLSLDEAVMYFTSRRLRPDSSNANSLMPETAEYYEDVYITFLNDDNTWSKPKLMNFSTELETNEATVSVSADGTEVYVYVDTEGGGDLYSASFLENGYNAELEHLPGEINSKDWETHCSITPDGQTMFFTSNRPGGMGGLDIYRVVKLPNQQWSKALPLPAPINTPYDEDAPFIHPSGNILYFSSNNPNSMGGCDVFWSRIMEPNPLVFSDPKNMGAPVNTPDDDVFFVMGASGNVGYYSSAQNGGFGGHDIFRVEFATGLDENFAVLKGRIKTTDGSPVPEDVVAYVTNKTQDEELQKFKPRAWDGRFVMVLKPCNEYEVVYNRGNEVLRTETIKVPCNSNYKEFYTELKIDSLTLDMGTVAVNGDENNPDKNNNRNTPTTNEPLTYEKYFDYNGKEVMAAEQRFATLAEAIAQRSKNGKVEIVIEASASRVPTTTFKTNDKLSRARSAETREKLDEALRAKGASMANIKYTRINSLVQGPRYNNDYQENRAEYGKYQYVKIWVK